ncbi:Cysteine proteinase inhibitor 6 [Abeliophyllum distichum]|uniref:Cysteine proteinase inhibitor n=1 Tax=Abeliophyllum distichum TaxID=126358 RepID=A0ABD1U1M0_9LAMI
MRALLICINTSFVFLTVALLLVSPHSFSHPNPQDHKLGFCGEDQENHNKIEMATLGGLRDSTTQNSLEIDTLARFAVDEHNKKENALLELARVVKAREQVVSGTLHHLTLEVIDSGKKKLYEAKIWVKPWLNFKELQDFKHVEDVPSFTSSDLGVKKDEQGSGWRSVPVHDPVVQDAADHAVKTIQERSNSLLPYELREIVHAKAEVVEKSPAKIDMLLKVNRGGKEEKFKVEVHKNNEGGFHLNHMESDNS